MIFHLYDVYVMSLLYAVTLIFFRAIIMRSLLKNDFSEDLAPVFFFFSVPGKRHREDNLFLFKPPISCTTLFLYRTIVLLVFTRVQEDRATRRLFVHKHGCATDIQLWTVREGTSENTLAYSDPGKLNLITTCLTYLKIVK